MSAIDRVALLAHRIAPLWAIIGECYEGASPQTQAFVLRILMGIPQLRSGVMLPPFDLAGTIETSRYGGTPAISYIGFGIGASGANAISGDIALSYFSLIERIQGRSTHANLALASDEVTLLGIADGLSVCREIDGRRFLALSRWLVPLIDGRRANGRSDRLRDLAADLLDRRGRLHTKPDQADLEAQCVDLCLRAVWKLPFESVTTTSARELLAVYNVVAMGVDSPIGDIERASIWLCAMNALLSRTSSSPLIGEDVFGERHDERSGILQGVAPVPLALEPRVGHYAPMATTTSVTDPALDEVRQSYRQGNLVVFAGAGISMAVGLPSWEVLARDLAMHPRVQRADSAVQHEINDLLQTRQLIDALTAIERCIGDAEFASVVERRLDDSMVVSPPDVAVAIAELEPKLRAVLTTNIDGLLERAFKGAWKMLAHATPDVAQRKRIILKLHGTLVDRSTWVFTRGQYDKAMHVDAVLKTAFSTFFQAYTLLFVGYGLADADFDIALGWVRAFGLGRGPRHFALMPEGKLGPTKKQQLETSGVRIIEYAAPGGDHSEVVKILRSLP